jgi:hypothetical protein
VILFQETLEFKHTISLCYGKQVALVLQACMPFLQVWAMAQVVVNILGHVVQHCELNQSRGYWFLSDALFTTIFLVCKSKVDCLTFDANETQDFDGELITLSQCMQKQVVGVLEPFLSFLVALQTHEAHNIHEAQNMLDPSFKGLGLIIQYVGKERTLQVVGDYEIHVLFLFLICAYKVLNPTNVSERNVGGSASQSSQCSFFV